MTTHKAKVTLQSDGELTLDGLPFRHGDEVSVIVEPAGSSRSKNPKRNNPKLSTRQSRSRQPKAVFTATDNAAKGIENTKSEDSLGGAAKAIWKNADKVAVMTSGGIVLGASLAQVPGAVVGGLIAGGYGIYTSLDNQGSEDSR